MKDQEAIYDRLVNQSGTIREIWTEVQRLEIEDTLLFFARASAQLSEITSAALAHGSLGRLGEQHSFNLMCVQRVLGDRIMHEELGMPRDADAPIRCDPEERLQYLRRSWSPQPVSALTS